MEASVIQYEDIVAKNKKNAKVKKIEGSSKSLCSVWNDGIALLYTIQIVILHVLITQKGKFCKLVTLSLALALKGKE